MHAPTHRHTHTHIHPPTHTHTQTQSLFRIQDHTVGVFVADQIPLVWTRPTAFIFNTQSHDKSGLHWVAIYVNKNGDVWYFDSFGVPSYIPDHINHIRRNVDNFDGMHDNYKVKLQIHVVIFALCFYITCLWVLELHIFLQTFLVTYAKMIKFLKLYF